MSKHDAAKGTGFGKRPAPERAAETKRPPTLGDRLRALMGGLTRGKTPPKTGAKRAKTRRS